MPKYPCLGYSSRTDAIAALSAKGRDAHEIAEMTGVPLKQVYTLLHYARTRQLKDDPERSVYYRLTLRDSRALAPHAEARGMRPRALAERLIRTLITENLIDAVLDDASEGEG